MPYAEAGRLGRGLSGGGVLGGLGDVSGTEECPGLPSLSSTFSFVDSLGACSSPAGAGLVRAI